MEELKEKKKERAVHHRIYFILWIFLTFLSLPYFLATVNLNVSQFFLLGNLFVDIHPGIHHGLLGYITLSIGIFGMQSSTHIERPQTRKFLFFISLFFLAKGMYYFADDVITEQISHNVLEQTYMWDWTAPHLEFFTLSVAFITIGMKETETILAMALPVLIVSIFTTPFVSIAVGYLILILVYKNEEVGRTPWLTEEIESWKLFKWSFRVVWGLMVFLSISLLLAEFGINVGV